MMRLLIWLGFVAVLGLTPVCASAAESFKLRFLQSVLQDEKEGQIVSPEGVACGSGASFLVADTGNGRLLRYIYENRRLTGGSEIKLPELPHPVLLQQSASGTVYVFDGKLRRIAKLNQDGSFAGYLDPQGAAGTPVLKSFKIDASENLYMLDIKGHRVLVCDPAGKVTREVPMPEQLGFASDLAVTQGGDILLLDSLKDAVLVAPKDATAFKPLTKNLQDHLSFAAYITTDARGTIYVVDRNGGAIVAIALDGTVLGRQLELGWKNSLVYYPAQICVSPTGETYVADRGNNRVQIFERLR